MIKNYFRTAWRNLFKNKGFSLTNILGLAIGMTCALFILLWVQNELNYDKFHKNYNTIYQVMANRNFNNEIFTDNSMVFPLASSLQNTYPQIKNAVVTSAQESHILNTGDTRLKKKGYTVSSHFFELFSWEFIKGNEASAIIDPASIVLTTSSAKALFGDEDPINKIVRIDDHADFKVTALIKDVSDNSTLQFDYIIPYDYSLPGVKRNMNEWTNSSWNVYLQMTPGADIQQLNKNITALKKQHAEDRASAYFAFPMKKWHLYSDFKNGKNAGGMIEYVQLFSIIGIIILLIACVNFMNLSTARSEKRAKEVGIRKTLGSAKHQLIFQFFFESLILAFIAFALSVIAAYLLLPSFNQLVAKHLVLDLTRPVFWIGAIVIIVFTGVVAGSYPALYLSSFSPVKVLKGTFQPIKKAVMPRHVLIIAQFAISILLISATIIIYQQVQHVKGRDMGYNPDNLIMIPTTSATQKKFTIIKQELLGTGMVNAVTRTSSPITEVWWKTPGPDWEGKPADANMIFSGISAEVDFTRTMGIKMLAGKDFSGMPSDSSVMLLNKAAIEAMGLKDPIGMQMRYNGKIYTVSGITSNVVMESPYKPVDPMMIINYPDYSNSIGIRLNDNVLPHKALSSIETIFKKYNPAFPFEYQFADQEFGKKFITEELINRITNIFAALAIFICCIGLAGLAAFTIEKRIREIGIRKVLGASVQQVLLLVSKEFLVLVVIAFVIATPLSWWLMSNWLEKYAYHVSISIWLFSAVGVAVLLLALLIVSLNTIKTAIANPVKSLRTE
ncbi:MAG TPA: ABC transporter permease [Chitinophagaceae bacterium]|nr:ABC transporter permease [Chitinophagaceae bacterium]